MENEKKEKASAIVWAINENRKAKSEREEEQFKFEEKVK